MDSGAELEVGFETFGSAVRVYGDTLHSIPCSKLNSIISGEALLPPEALLRTSLTIPYLSPVLHSVPSGWVVGGLDDADIFSGTGVFLGASNG